MMVLNSNSFAGSLGAARSIQFVQISLPLVQSHTCLGVLENSTDAATLCVKWCDNKAKRVKKRMAKELPRLLRDAL